MGKADLSVYGNELGFPEDVYSSLVDHPGVEAAAPVVWGTGHVKGRQDDILFIQGVDLLIDPAMRQYELVATGDSPGTILNDILKRGSILLTDTFAHRYGLKKGDSVSFVIDDRIWELIVAGLLKSKGSQALLTGNLALADISFAQSLFQKHGLLDRIDLLLDQGQSPEAMQQALEKVLPSYLSVDFSQGRGKNVEKLLASFQLNLEVLSLIALLVGMFLVYNTVSYSVISRREEIGIIRSQGCSRLVILLVFLFETCVVAGTGSLIGVYLGIRFASGSVSLMSSTISSLYLITRVEDIHVPIGLLYLGVAGGVCTSLLASIYPAKDAAFSPPISAITKGSYEIKRSGRTPLLVILSVILFMLAVGVVWLPISSPTPGYFACFFFILGVSFLIFPLLNLLKRPIMRIFSVFGVSSELGTGLFFSHQGRNSVALAALATAVSMVVSIVIMVESFRSTVTVWLNQTLQADIIITMESRFKRGGTAKMSSSVMDAVRKLPHIVDVDPFRYINMEYQGRAAAIGVLDFLTISKYNNLPVKEGRDPFLRARNQGGVVISEGFATIHGKSPGDTLLLHTPRGDVLFTIHGVYYDYAVQYGIILFDWDTFSRYWDDRSLSSLGVYVEEGTVEEVRREIWKFLTEREGLSLFSNRDIKEKALGVFDQTFQITRALQIIAVVIAILGIIGSLASSVMERRREIGILRSQGLTRLDTGKLMIMEASLLGGLGVLMGIAVGVILSVILIDVINFRSFGWTIQHTYPITGIVTSVLPIFFLTLPAGIPPALKALSIDVSSVLRHE